MSIVDNKKCFKWGCCFTGKPSGLAPIAADSPVRVGGEEIVPDLKRIAGR
jgi:hypothetical protein